MQLFIGAMVLMSDMWCVEVSSQTADQAEANSNNIEISKSAVLLFWLLYFAWVGVWVQLQDMSDTLRAVQGVVAADGEPTGQQIVPLLKALSSVNMGLGDDDSDGESDFDATTGDAA